MANQPLEGRMNDRKYLNWLEANKCLEFLGKVLLPFADAQMKTFHNNLLEKENLKNKSCSSGCKPRNDQEWGCDVCSEWKTEIWKHYRHTDYRYYIYWENCHPPSWRTDHWEVAKAYMPRGQAKVTRADQCDVAALLKLINHCSCFNTDAERVRDIIVLRNDLAHSSEMSMEDEWMTKFKRTLETFADMIPVPEMDEAKQLISKVLTSNLKMTMIETGSSDKEERIGDQPENKRPKKEGLYPLNCTPVGLCLIINNKNFQGSSTRRGTDKDAQSLGEVFSSLGFRVLMCEDQTVDQMDHCLKCFRSSHDLTQLQRLKEFCGESFTDIQQPSPQHGDAFFCCILSHGDRGVVMGVDSERLSIEEITKTFKSWDESELTDKPKVFIIQACQGNQRQRGVLLPDLMVDSYSTSIPEMADFLVAMATVEDYEALRHRVNGSWFIQTLCEELIGSQRGEDFLCILTRVNNGVSQKEGSGQVGAVKQMPEFRSTLRKSLVLRPC